jgi:hypothetical protein
MSLVSKPGRTLAFLALTCMLTARFASAQDAAQVNARDLEVVGMGHIKTKGSPVTLFRVFETHDGIRGRLYLTKADSLESAELQIEQWLKAARTVTSREHNQTKGGQLISDRILAVADLPKPDNKEFMIIRRDDLECYLIESMSLQVAMQIESLIEHK